MLHKSRDEGAVRLDLSKHQVAITSFITFITLLTLQWCQFCDLCGLAKYSSYQLIDVI